jgi:hypothetical protein
MEQRLTTSEKVKIEISRRKMTQEELGVALGLNKISISNRMTSNAWKPLEVFYMKHALGFNL